MKRRRLRQKNVPSPMQEAIQYCKEGKDKGDLEKRFINENIGWGVFTTKNRTKGEFLLEYAGDIISRQDADNREAIYAKEGKGSFLFYFGKMCVDATDDTGRLGRLVNDAVGDGENCIMKIVRVEGSCRLCLFARRDIREREELRYDYGVENLPWRQKESQETHTKDNHLQAAEQTKSKDQNEHFVQVSSTSEAITETTHTCEVSNNDEQTGGPNSCVEEDALPCKHIIQVYDTSEAIKETPHTCEISNNDEQSGSPNSCVEDAMPYKHIIQVSNTSEAGIIQTSHTCEVSNTDEQTGSSTTRVEDALPCEHFLQVSNTSEASIIEISHTCDISNNNDQTGSQNFCDEDALSNNYHSESFDETITSAKDETSKSMTPNHLKLNKSKDEGKNFAQVTECSQAVQAPHSASKEGNKSKPAKQNAPCNNRRKTAAQMVSPWTRHTSHNDDQSEMQHFNHESAHPSNNSLVKRKGTAEAYCFDSDFNPFEWSDEESYSQHDQGYTPEAYCHDSDFNPFEWSDEERHSQHGLSSNAACKTSSELTARNHRRYNTNASETLHRNDQPAETQDVNYGKAHSSMLWRPHTAEANCSDSDFNPFESSDAQDLSNNPSCSKHPKQISKKCKKKHPSKSFSDSHADLSDSSGDENITADYPAIQEVYTDSKKLIRKPKDTDIVPDTDCSSDAADNCNSRFEFPNLTKLSNSACPVQVADVNSNYRTVSDDTSDEPDHTSDHNFDPNYDEDDDSSCLDSEDNSCSEEAEDKHKKKKSKFEKGKKMFGTESSSLPEVVSSSTPVLTTTSRKKSFDDSDDMDNSSSDNYDPTYDEDDDSSCLDSEEKAKDTHSKKKPAFEKKKKVLGAESSSLTDGVSSSITVLTTTNTKKQRSWDRHNICVYCEEGFSKLPRHFERNHSSEKEVAYILSKNKNSKERKLLWLLLTNKGNHAHNLQVISSGQGNFIPAKRQAYITDVANYLPCEYCLGFFIRSDLWKHHKCCPALKLRGCTSSKGRVQGRSAMLLPVPKTSNEAFNQQVLGKMNNDTIGLTVRQDDLICKFGLKLFMKFAEPHQFQYCAQKMRQLGRLVVTMKQAFPETLTSLRDAIHPQNFCDVVEAVRQTAGFDPVSKQYKIPSLALQIGFSLRAVAAILKGEALKTGDKTLQEAAECFDKLCGLEWSGEVSHNALVTLEKRKWNKPQMLPLGEDVVKLSSHLKEVSKKYSELLDACPSDNQSWYILAKATLSQLILFNRRRSGEVERLLLEECNNITTEANEDVLKSLSKWEQSLCKKLKRLEIRGKRGRKVPILMSEILHSNVEKLISTRKDVDVSETNIYLFARPFPSQHPIRGQDCIRQFSVECGVSHPENITSTRLRKQIGTLSQVINLQDNELDILATFMGHDIAVHRNYYRLPEQTLQLVKVSRILLAMESGQTLDFSGRSLDEIEIDIDDPGEEESGNHSLEEDWSDLDTEADDVGKIDSENHCLGEEPADVGMDQEVSKNPQTRGVSKSHLTEASSRGPPAKGSSKSALAKGSSKSARAKGSNKSARAKGSSKSALAKGSCRGFDKKKVTKTVARKVTKKKAWSDKETQAVLRHFQKHVHLHRVPGKRECDACLEKEPVLHERQWKAVKYKVYNLIQEQKRKGK